MAESGPLYFNACVIGCDTSKLLEAYLSIKSHRQKIEEGGGEPSGHECRPSYFPILPSEVVAAILAIFASDIFKLKPGFTGKLKDVISAGAVNVLFSALKECQHMSRFQIFNTISQPLLSVALQKK